MSLLTDDDVVLGGHVVRDVMVDDEAEEAVEERQVDLLVYLMGGEGEGE